MDPDPDDRSDKHVIGPSIYGDMSAERPFLNSLSHVSPLPVGHQAETGMDVPGSRKGYPQLKPTERESSDQDLGEVNLMVEDLVFLLQ